MDSPARLESAVLVPMVRRGWPSIQAPRFALFLLRARANRIGVRAFSTLEGYAGRNWRNGVGFFRRKRENARPPSRFSSERVTKADAKQQNRASVRVRDRLQGRVFRHGEPRGSVRG